MTTDCIVLVDHLKDGKSVLIHEDFDPAYLELNDEELSFSNPIRVEGSSYLAEDLIIIQLDIQGTYHLPCSVCNRPVTMPFTLKNAYITMPLSECSGGKLHFKQDLRELILLEVPTFTECNQRQCPERIQMMKYLKQPAHDETSKQEELYYPFDGLEEQMKPHE